MARANQVLLILGLAVALTIFAVGAIVILEGRKEAWQEAKTSSENLMLALKRDIARNFVLLDLSLQGAAEALSEPGIDAVSPGIFQHAVFDRSASAEDVGSFLILDSAGKIVGHSNQIAISNVDLSDRDYFTVHRDHAETGLFISDVFRSRLRGSDLSVALSRRLQAPDGRFAGVVVGAMRLDYFKRLLQNLDLGPHGAITLFASTGRIVYRQPYREKDVNRDVSQSQTFRQMSQAAQGQFVGTAAIDGVRRLYTFAHLNEIPLVIAVNLSVDDIYAGWRQRALMTGSVLAVLCLSTLALTLLFYREVQRRSAAESKLIAITQQLEVMAATDGLTGLSNRRKMKAEIEREWKRAVRASSSIALLMIDVDHFKLFNDRYGHPEGDEVLRSVARCLQENVLRSSDAISRFGGEEFVALLPDTDEAGALATAERVRAGIEALQIPHECSTRGHVTISIGASVALPSIGEREAGLLKAADVALYEAKRAGRNRVEFAFCHPDRTRHPIPNLLTQSDLVT